MLKGRKRVTWEQHTHKRTGFWEIVLNADMFLVTGLLYFWVVLINLSLSVCSEVKGHSGRHGWAERCLLNSSKNSLSCVIISVMLLIHTHTHSHRHTLSQTQTHQTLFKITLKYTVTLQMCVTTEYWLQECKYGIHWIILLPTLLTLKNYIGKCVSLEIEDIIRIEKQQ